MHMSHGSTAVIAEISAGLLAPVAHISPKFLYDGLGSKLFEAICELPSIIRPAPKRRFCRTAPKSRAWSATAPR
jgi:uncharacterized SAM-dependent methyltransferase